MATDLTHPYLHTVWCDDLRQELGNKVSLMGVYAAEIVLRELPALLPKLVSHSSLVFPKDRKPQHLRFKLMLDDAVLVDQAADLSLAPTADVTAGGHPTTRGSMNFTLVMSPLEIPAGTRLLQAVVELDDQTVYGNKLWVTAQPSPTEEPPAD